MKKNMFMILQSKEIELEMKYYNYELQISETEYFQTINRYRFWVLVLGFHNK